MKIKTKPLVLLLLLFAVCKLQAQQITEYKLDNGLTIILNPMPEATNVFGMVAVRAGAYNEPEDATGLAHYLEHVVFKGTQEMGTTNWEAEKEYYDQIIELFEQKRATEDNDERKELEKKINELSIEAGKYTVSNDFANLVQGMGGTGLNAGTSYDFTVYYNSFPPFQMERWLELYAHRFQKNVFRGFQAELENVYEEKNMYADNPFSVLGEIFQENLYGQAHPYGRSIIGTAEHLKNPSLKSLIEFYETNYVTNNMALILSGKFDADQVKPMIEKTFGKWENEPAPETKGYEVRKFKGKEVEKTKSSPYPIGFWAYETVPMGHEDQVIVEVISSMLSNGQETGLLDKLALDGDLLGIDAYYDSRKYAGHVVINAVPNFSLETFQWNSVASVEKLIEDEIEKLQKGEFEDWLLDAVKSSLLVDFELMKESTTSSGYNLAYLYLYDLGLDYVEKYRKKLESISKEQIVEAANKYIGKNYLYFYSLEGTSPKEKIKKPDIEPIVPSSGQKSKFAQYLENVPMGEAEEKYIDFNVDVKQGEIQEGVKLYYTPNPKNDIFSMTIKFGVGSHKIPAIGMATDLMNSAGIMATYEAHETKEAFAKLGCTYYCYNDASDTYISLQGKEANLEAACKLLTKLFLMPALDEKQVDRLIGTEVGGRNVEKKDKATQFNALQNYLKYGENSPQLKRMPTEDIKELTLSSMAAKFIEATHYKTTVHYVGQKPYDELTATLKGSLVFPADLKESESPYIRPLVEPKKRTIYFIHNSDASQSDIVLFAKSKDFDLEQQPNIAAFNQYFAGGFNGLVMQELRELRSFAYSAGASYVTPDLTGHPSYFIGSIGTQGDKTVDALSEFLKLIDEMPEKPERIDNIKNYLEQASLSSKPNFRYLSQRVEYWQDLGFDQDPSKVLIPKYKELTFDDIVSFYNENLKGMPLSIAIIGNKKEIDMDALEEIADIEKISTSKLFKD